MNALSLCLCCREKRRNEAKDRRIEEEEEEGVIPPSLWQPTCAGASPWFLDQGKERLGDVRRLRDKSGSRIQHESTHSSQDREAGTCGAGQLMRSQEMTQWSRSTRQSGAFALSIPASQGGRVIKKLG